MGQVEAADPGAGSEPDVGALLAAVVTLARGLGVDPEAAARHAAGEFRLRVERMLRLADQRDADPADLDLGALTELWNEAGG